MLGFIGLVVVLSLATAEPDYAWSYTCQNNKCEKVPLSETNGEYKPLAACRLTCIKGATMWPKPSNIMNHGDEVTCVDISGVSLGQGLGASPRISQLVDLFKGYYAKANSECKNKLVLNLAISDANSVLDMSTDESYTVHIQKYQDTVTVTVQALTYQGGRHGLETVSQLAQLDPIDGNVYIPTSVLIKDAPVYKWRGVLLDTSRNFFSLATIRTIIDGLSAAKLNTLHWHITDTHSWPFQSKRRPKMTVWGAYSPDKIYTEEDIQAIVAYADVRGVRVIPELDAPAHSGNGYQWGEEEGLGKLAICVNREPWRQFCVEPPCGQMNLANPNLYDVVEDIYRDMLDAFSGSAFHIGGDEVNFNCWNSTSEITDYMGKKGIARDEEGFMQLWDEYQVEALKRFKKANGGKLKDMVLWTSHMTEPQFLKYLDPKIYTVQYWEHGENKQLPNLVNKGFNVIMSNYNDLYLDCGFGAWIGSGGNWCKPYKEWQQIYMNDPKKILAEKHGITDPAKWKQIIGAEAALWTEQAGDRNALVKIFPRAYALAERYWSDPTTGWLEAEPRLVYFNNVMERRGVSGNTLKPEWCVHNEQLCV